METTVVWRISDREPGCPTPYQRFLHELTQHTAGPDDDSPLFCHALRQNEWQVTLTAYQTSTALDACTETEAAEAVRLRLLYGAENAPRVAGGGLRAAARPEAPRAPSAPSRSTSYGRTLAA